MTEQSRSIEKVLEIDAPIDAVWKALTDAEELTNWFPPVADVKPGKGGHIRTAWSEREDWTCAIDAWDENRHLRLIWAESTPEDQRASADFVVPFRIAVDYHLESNPGGGTILRLVHTGFSAEASWDNQYDGTVRGWDFELRGLKLYLERHRGVKREVINLSRKVDDLPLEDAWERLTGPDGLTAKGTIEGRKAGDELDVETATGDTLRGEIQIINPPKDLAVILSSLNDAYLRIRIDESCVTAGQRRANLLLSTFEIGDEQRAGLERRLDELMDRLFAPVAK
jgi:uncharacterized protein YndB with AHSA1/START domain